MEKFTFKFNSLLNVKQKIQEQKEIEYGIAVQNLEKAKQNYMEIEHRKTLMIEQFKQIVTEKITANKTQEFNYFINKLKKDMIAQTQVIERKEQIVKLKQQELLDALTQSKMFEKLKEKDEENYKVELKLDELKTVDEIVTYKYMRREN